MRGLAGVVLASATIVAAAVLAVRFGDRELLVPPPDAVAEGFFRAVVTHRPGQAQPYLVKPVRNADLVRLTLSLERRLGRVRDVQAEILSRTDEEALVSVRLRSDRSSEAMGVSLAWNGEEWKVVQSAFE